MSLDQWHHVAVVRDLDALTLSIFVNGTFINSTSILN